MKYRLSLTEAEPDILKEIPFPSIHGYDYWYNPLYMQYLGELHEIKPLLLRVYKGEELIALLPLFERKKLGMKALVCPVGGYYQGIHLFMDPNTSSPRVLLDNLAISERIAQFLNKEYSRINFKLLPDNTDVRGFTWNKYSARPMYTFRHDLSQNLHILQDEKKSLRKAAAAGLSLVEHFDPDPYFRMQAELDKRKNHSFGVSFESLARYFEKLHAADLLKQYNVMQGDKILSSNIIYSDAGKAVYTVFMASEPEGLKLGAATFHSIELLSQLPPSCRIFDYCGANVQDVARFKAALGLQLQVFFNLST
ncbi:MAG: hypothetical protein PHC50_02515 [Candidatus Cloacimonetes bacterium]|nr:hypothetical protein [Candidatus Cloacimonadota bacterium]